MSDTECPVCGNPGRLATNYSLDWYRCTKCRETYEVDHTLCAYESCSAWADIDGYCHFHASRLGIQPDGEPYYHCTGNRGRCGEPYTRQETLVHEFASTLSSLVIPSPILEWLATEINNSDTTEQGAREATIKRLEQERARIQQRINTLYEDRLEGRITATMYDNKARTLQAQQDEINSKIATAQETARVPLTTALDIARLTSNACSQFREQSEEEQRKLLTMIVKEATWQDGGLRTTLLEPFEQLRRSNQLSTTKINGNGTSGMDMQIWLPERNTDPNTVLENRKYARFSAPLTKGKKFEDGLSL